MTDLRETLAKHGHTHLLEGYDDLPPVERERFEADLRALDFVELAKLYATRDSAAAAPTADRIAPIPVEPAGDPPADVRQLGEDALRRVELAVLLVAGGQGTRLGFAKPKGMYPVGPISGATLFRIHAEKVRELSKRYGKPIPFLVMTSTATHAETVADFEANGYFGLAKDQVHFFQQGTMPALDAATGKVLLEAPGKLALSPNGHGGTLTALADSGLLAKLKSKGVKHVFYFQVDNPLVLIGEPGFLGMHIARDAEVSSKVVFKEKPEERVGVLALVDGRCGIVEYSDMPPAMTVARESNGDLTYRAGNPAIHLFSVTFLERVTGGTQRLAYHVARKKVAHVGEPSPKAENALKFELFIFDALPLADRWLCVQTLREEEFAPLKNASGTDSLQTLQFAVLARAERWLRRAGVDVPKDAVVETAPSFALFADDVKGKAVTLKCGENYLT